MGKSNWAAAAQSRIDSFAKPPGALGTLESIAVTLCHQQATLRPAAAPASLLTFCADHGVKQAEPGISPFPPAVTQNIFRALAAGVAGASVLALSAGATCTVVDVGVDGDVSDVAATGAGCTVRHDKLACGSYDMLSTQAMGAELCARAIAAGRAAVRAEVSQKGVRVVAVGEVGIGNTTAAAALLSVLTGAPPVDCCGAGTGLDDVSVKVRVVQSALQLHAEAFDAGGGEKGKAARASAALAAVGGLELAAMAGAYMEAASCGVVAVVDGFISSVAALCAAHMEPPCRDAMVLATASAEAGGALVSATLGGAKPALDMGLRLGEGSGAALMLPIVRAAAEMMARMATLEEAMKL